MNFNYSFVNFKKVLKKKTPFFEKIEIEHLLFLENPYFKEKRKRLQISESLNFYLSKYTQYDFFSPDLLEILYKSEILPILFNKKVLTSDMVLHVFFDSYNPILTNLFNELNITKKKSENYLSNKWQKPLTKKQLFKNKLFNIFEQIIPFFLTPSLKKKQITTAKILYSPELIKIINKSIKKANLVYKTPVVSVEIFFLTLLEEKGSHSRELFTFLVPDLKNILKFRYKILLNIHKIEKRIYSLLPKGLIFFDYLLKLQLTSPQFYNLTAFPFIHYYAVLSFRNKMIKKLLFVKYPKLLKSEIIKEILYKPKKYKKFKPKLKKLYFKNI